MIKKIHLVGEVSQSAVESLIQQLETDENIEKIIYKDATHDLHIHTSSKEYMHIVAQAIEELQLNIKVVERKKSNDKDEKPFEKRVFLFSDLKSTENAIFLVSYLLNDPQIREAKFDHNQKILTVETSDPFIYTKLRHVIDAFGENIEITENYVKEQTFNYELMYRYLFVALLLFSFSLYVVTLQEPTLVTIFSGIVMCGLLAVRPGLHAYDLIKKKDYLNSTNLVILGAFLLLVFNRALDAAIALFAYQWLHAAFKKFEGRVIDLLVSNVDNLVRVFKVKTEEGIEEKQVEEIEQDDIVLLEAKNTVFFDGVVVEGVAQVDTLLMKGQLDPQTVKVGDEIINGSRIIEGNIELKVIKPYTETEFNQIYDWTPKYLLEKGYLEVRERKDYFNFTIAMLVLSAIGIVVGLITKNNRFIFTGLTLVVTCYPFALALLSPYVYDNAMIEALRHSVLLKDENNLGKLVEWLRKQKHENLNEELDLDSIGLKFNQGNYLDETIRNESDVIYHNKTSLLKVFRYIKDFDKQWVYFKYITYGVKIVGILFFYIQFFSFVGVLILNCLLAFIILVAMNSMLDKEVG